MVFPLLDLLLLVLLPVLSGLVATAGDDDDDEGEESVVRFERGVLVSSVSPFRVELLLLFCCSCCKGGEGGGVGITPTPMEYEDRADGLLPITPGEAAACTDSVPSTELLLRFTTSSLSS